MIKRINIEEEALVKLLAGHDPAAIELLYDHYSPALYGLIFRIVQDDAIAENILKEVFIKVSKNFNQSNQGKTGLFIRMINICRNLSLEKVSSDKLINQSYNQAIEKAVYNNGSTSSVSYSPGSVEWKEINNKLDREYKVIIDLLFLEGLSQFETAKKLNIPLGTVKTRSHAALQKFESIFPVNKSAE